MKIFIFLCVWLLVSSGISAQDSRPAGKAGQGGTPYKVAILPVEIHSPEDIGYLKHGLMDMLGSRVELRGRVEVLEKSAVKKALPDKAGEMDTAQARKIGEALEADFVVYGSLTKLGESASLDLKVVRVKEEQPASSVFIQSKKMEEIIARVDDLARMIDEKVLGYSISPPAAVAQVPRSPEPQVTAKTPAATVPGPVAATPGPAPSPAPAAFPAPSAGIPSPSAPPAAPPGFRPMPLPGKVQAGVIPAGFWQSTPFPFKVKGMAVGDFDGDGKNELAMIDERNLWIYRWDNEFKLLKKISGKNTDQYLAVDCGDIRKSGKAQIFITNLEGDQTGYSQRKLSSFVVVHQDGDYRVAEAGLEWYLRVLPWGEKGPVLLGQKKGLKIPFEAGIYELGWNGKGFKDSPRKEISRVFSLFGFSPFSEGGKNYYAYIDVDARLKVLNDKGKQIWRGNTNYGSDNSFRMKPMAPLINDQGDELAFINVRIISRGNEIVVVRNISPVGQLFKRQQVFSGGEVQILGWNGAMFMETWKSPEIPGYVADFQVGNLDNAPGSTLIVAVNLPKESILSGSAGSALMVSKMQ